jgi:hypothetical protein
MGEELQKPIRLSEHAAGYLGRRGFTVSEVEETIQTSEWRPAELRRLEAINDLPFSSRWNGAYYTTKRVRPIFVEEPSEIVVVTVYTYFF